MKRLKSLSVASLTFLVFASMATLSSLKIAAADNGGTPVGNVPVGQPPAIPQLYRIVGCLSHGNNIYLNGPRRREVAIGFDDGPWSDTLAFVQMLERSHAQATFFTIGEQVTSAYRTTMLRELKDRDSIGNHSFTHPFLTRSGDTYSQLQRTNQAIHSQTGYTPCVFRPPYGDYNQSVIQTAHSLGLATVYWSVDPSDYLQPGAGAIAQRVLSQVRPGAIIISHDGGGPRGQTLAAYPTIIAALHSRGYKIVTIPELLGFRPTY